MSIKRGPSPADNYAQISNDALRDSRLSWKARGLLGYLMSHAQGWRTSIARLMREAPDGRDSVRSGLNELIALGYLERSDKRVRLPGGRLGDYEYTITDRPESGYPTLGEPTLGNRPPKKTTVKKTKPKNTKTLNGPAGGESASPSQIEYLRDLHIHGGGVGGSIEGWLSSLTAAEADAEIREALAAIPRGRHYRGNPDSDGLSTKGHEVAQRRMIPGGDSGA